MLFYITNIYTFSLHPVKHKKIDLKTALVTGTERVHTKFV